MTAGDIGFALIINFGGYVATGATCTLFAAPGPPAAPSQMQEFGPMTVSSDGLSATYLTTGIDFASGGTWNVQAHVVNGDDDFASLIGQIYVVPRL